MLDRVVIKLIRDSDGQTFEFGSTSDWMFVRDSFDGFSSVDNEINSTEYTSRDGGFISNKRVASKIRTFEAIYVKPSLNETERRNIISFLSVKDTFKCWVYYGNRAVWQSCHLYRMQTGMSARIRRAMKVTVSLMFEDPFWNSEDDFGENIAALEPLIGFPFLSALYHSYGVDSYGVERFGPIGTTGARFVFSPEIEIYNDGESETYCKIVIKSTGHAVNPKVIINENFIQVNDTLTQGDEVIIDMVQLPPKVTKNGVNWIGHCDRSSSFSGMVLEKGSNKVSYSAEDGQGNLAIYLYYNKRYEAI